MFESIIGVEEIEASKIFDYLYQAYFYVDFIENKTYLDGNIYIDPQIHQKEEGKELCFWHLTTRTQRYQVKEGNRIVTKKERLLDIDRADRLEWVKQIIENQNEPAIKTFYKRESSGKRPIRLYLWAFNEDFVVILQKLGRSSSFLVTSFYITHEGKRHDYQKYYEYYRMKKDPDLRGCEWF